MASWYNVRAAAHSDTKSSQPLEGVSSFYARLLLRSAVNSANASPHIVGPPRRIRPPYLCGFDLATWFPGPNVGRYERIVERDDTKIRQLSRQVYYANFLGSFHDRYVQFLAVA